jgi:hypothetical protein
MKKALLILAAVASLASCRESNTNVKSAPSAELITIANTLQFDTTFTSSVNQPRNYSYIAEVVVGTTKTTTVPVKIAWTTTTEGGCPQVASLKVYQVGGVGSRTSLAVKAMRDAACKPGPMPTGTGRAATGAVYINLTCQSKDVHAFSNFRFMLNGLGYHDTLENMPLTAVKAPK